jgi:hypothetical protein
MPIRQTGSEPQTGRPTTAQASGLGCDGQKGRCPEGSGVSHGFAILNNLVSLRRAGLQSEGKQSRQVS